MIWGEPFGDRLPVCRMASTIEGLHSNDPHLKYSIDGYAGDLSAQWVANLNPGVEHLRKAHLVFFESLFAEPARLRGASRWGAKWVRLTADHAAYLKWLYPEAKIILLVRHPLQAYLSFKHKKWYTVRPHHQVRGVARFMAHWTYLARSFIESADRLGALLIRYEDLQADSDVLDQLERFTGIQIRRETLRDTVGARDKQQLCLSLWDRAVGSFLTGEVATKLGYSTSMTGGVKVDGAPEERYSPQPSSTRWHNRVANEAIR